MKALVALFFALCVTSAQAASHGSAWPNAGSPLGSNTTHLTNGESSLPFLNMLKLGGAYWTANGGSLDTGDENTLYAHCVDSNHYLNVDPATCASNWGTTFTYLISFLNIGEATTPFYPVGNYVLLWDGNGSSPTSIFQFNNTGQSMAPSSITSCPLGGHPNRLILAYNAPLTGRQELDQSSIGTGGSPPTNIRWVYGGVRQPGDVVSDCSTIGTREALLNSGEIFDPVYVSVMQYFNPIRNMDWMNIINNPISNWSERNLPTSIHWNEDQGSPTRIQSTSNPFDTGVPYEVQLAFCNKINADCWINTPFLATTAFVSSLASLAHSNLNTNLKLYVEAGNEWWNQVFGADGTGIVAAGGVAGNAAYPCAANANPSDSCPVPNPGTTGQNWNNFHALQAVRLAQGFQSVWGADYSRVIPVLGGQNGDTDTARYDLDFRDTDWGGLVCGGCSGNAWTGQAYTQLKMVSTAPYFPIFTGQCPYAWTADTDGGLTRCFQQATQGGLLEPAIGGNTTTHTTSSANACSVTTGIAANHYVVSSGHSYGALINGIPLQMKFDVNLLGVCDDLNVDGLGAVPLQFGEDVVVQDKTGGGGSPANISGTTLTITDNSNLFSCCTSFGVITIGSPVTGPGVSAGTVVTNYLTAPIQDSVTASITGTVMTVTATANPPSGVQPTWLVVGGTVAPSTMITGNASSGPTACNGSPCTGHGTTGTYAVSISQTVGSTAGLKIESPGYSGTYLINNSQTVTCVSCNIGVPAFNPTCCNTTDNWVLVYTSATSAGAMTPAWRVLCQGAGCAGTTNGYISQVLGFLTSDINFYTGAPYNLLYGSYEGGQTFAAPNSAELAVLYVSMARDYRYNQVYQQFFNGLRRAGLNGPFNHYTSFGILDGTTGFHGFNWGLLEDSQHPTGPKYSAALDYIRRTPCWWANCRH